MPRRSDDRIPAVARIVGDERIASGAADPDEIAKIFGAATFGAENAEAFPLGIEKLHPPFISDRECSVGQENTAEISLIALEFLDRIILESTHVVDRVRVEGEGFL